MADEREDINNLYGKVNELNTKVTALEASQPFLKEILERSVASNEKLSETMHEMQLTMTAMSAKSEEQAKTMEEMKQEFTKAHKETNDKINSIGHKVDLIEEKSKFDIHAFIKKNWPWITVLLGVGIYKLSCYVKF